MTAEGMKDACGERAHALGCTEAGWEQATFGMEQLALLIRDIAERQARQAASRRRTKELRRLQVSEALGDLRHGRSGFVRGGPPNGTT